MGVSRGVRGSGFAGGKGEGKWGWRSSKVYILDSLGSSYLALLGGE